MISKSPTSFFSSDRRPEHNYYFRPSVVELSSHQVSTPPLVLPYHTIMYLVKILKEGTHMKDYYFCVLLDYYYYFIQYSMLLCSHRYKFLTIHVRRLSRTTTLFYIISSAKSRRVIINRSTIVSIRILWNNILIGTLKTITNNNNNNNSNNI